MTEATSDTISRQSLGRIARLGDLYDARTDTLCGTTMFKQQLPPDSSCISRTDNHSFDSSVIIASSLQEKLHKLDVKGELKLSVLCGAIELGGSGKYLSQKKTSLKSVECTLLCKTTTVHDRLELFDINLKPDISLDALSLQTATHVVVGIYWGANFAITLTDKNSENYQKKDIEGDLTAKLEKLKDFIPVTAEAGAEYKKEEKEIWKRFSVEIFGDVLPDDSDTFPQTVDGALSMMKNMWQLIQKCNNGKGKPLTYIMFPLSSPAFQCHIGLKDTRALTVRNLDEGEIIRVVQLFDRITELTQQVHDQVDELNNRSRCVRLSELKKARSIEDSLEVQQATVKSDLVQRRKKLHSENADGRCLEAFCIEEHAKANEKARKLQDIYEDIQKRNKFTERCEAFGAKYLEHPVQQHIDSDCDAYENVYVLFDGQADAEATRKNQLAFIELAKASQNDSTIACYFTWTESTGRVAITHYRNNRPFRDDVAKELETKDMVQCCPAPRRAFCLMPIKVCCPGSNDGYCIKAERSWTCIKCNELIQFCPDDSAVYCGCGHATTLTHQFQFRCRSQAHDFAQFRDSELLENLTSSASRYGNCLFVERIC